MLQQVMNSESFVHRSNSAEFYSTIDKINSALTKNTNNSSFVGIFSDSLIPKSINKHKNLDPYIRELYTYQPAGKRQLLVNIHYLLKCAYSMTLQHKKLLMQSQEEEEIKILNIGSLMILDDLLKNTHNSQLKKHLKKEYASQSEKQNMKIDLKQKNEFLSQIKSRSKTFGSNQNFRKVSLSLEKLDMNEKKLLTPLLYKFICYLSNKLVENIKKVELSPNETKTILMAQCIYFYLRFFFLNKNWDKVIVNDFINSKTNIKYLNKKQGYSTIIKILEDAPLQEIMQQMKNLSYLTSA